MATITFTPDSVTVEPNKTATVTWTASATIFALIKSSDTSVATVSPTSTYASRGTLTITGVADGEATISFGSSNTGTLSVTVKTTLVTVKNSTLEGIANAIRSKNGESTTYLPSQMASKISAMAIASSNWSEVYSGQSTDFYDNTITILWGNAFNRTVMTNNSSAANYGPLLTSVSLPNVLTIWNAAFRYQKNLVSVSIPKATVLEAYAFGQCTSLSQFSADSLWSADQYAFSGCSSLASIKLPSFYRCSSIYVFQNCTSLSYVDLGNNTITSTELFSNYTFSGCTSLATLILRYAAMQPFHTGILDNTAIASGNGYIYIPSALVSSYQSARGWSTYADQFRAIEDYSDDGTVDGDINV